ncbi:Ornithine decarboxylase 1 [Dufourea novaeangliae]|uniref:Ornithine decarboxylase 1 n=1 Tax=Dufourea novaeangliae TaxID=178035 RepID=A0A154PLT1_DUFNO|nr:Ornithine decarboxylase 1 [Dufourea novaeangliae]
MVIKTLAALNCGFDCASEQEIREVMSHGVSAERIIFANPTKLPTHIRFSRKVNVEKMTVDSETELMKIKKYFPEAKIVIRIRCDAVISMVCLGTKYGCDPGDEAVRLIHLTKDLGLTLHGFSFHVGSPCGEAAAYGRGIEICKRLIDIARTIGCHDAQLIDIGGGFPGETGSRLDQFASVINDAIQDVDPSIKIISEPGQYYVTSAFTLASYIHTKKILSREEKLIRMYYVGCGVYTSFIEELLGVRARIPITLDKANSCSILAFICIHSQFEFDRLGRFATQTVPLIDGGAGLGDLLHVLQALKINGGHFSLQLSGLASDAGALHEGHVAGLRCLGQAEVRTICYLWTKQRKSDDRCKSVFTYCFRLLVGSSKLFTFVLQTTKFEFQFVKSAVHVGQFGATLGLFETFGELNHLHAQISALAFDLQTHVANEERICIMKNY